MKLKTINQEKKNSRKTDLLDHYIGIRLRQARLARKASQGEVGKTSGVTFQQVQKYENGQNRLCCARLYEISRNLKIPISFFFDGFAAYKAKMEGRKLTPEEAAEEKKSHPLWLEMSDTIKMMRLYNDVGDKNIKQAVKKLLKAARDKEGHAA